jgi:hypothetical protein
MFNKKMTAFQWRLKLWDAINHPDSFRRNEDNRLPNFPRLWSLLPFALSRKTRERVYEPAHQELLEDYIRACSLKGGRGLKRWLIICFTIRSIVMVGQCIAASMGDKGLRLLKRVFLALLGAEAVHNFRGYFIELIKRL